MITIGEMQISGMLTMLMLALILVLRVPQRAMHHPGFAWARWLMVGGTMLIAIQFFVQHQMGLRQMGITQAVLVNLLLFVPASLLIGMAVLHVQRRGRVKMMEWAVGVLIIIVTTTLLLLVTLLDGVPLTEHSPMLRRAEYVGAGLYMLLQLYLFVLQYREYRRLQKAVDEYYDHARNDLLRWMGLSVRMMALLSLLVPFIIFSEGLPLVSFSTVFFFFVFYSVISMYSFGISEDTGRVEEAEAVPSLPNDANEYNVKGDLQSPSGTAPRFSPSSTLIGAESNACPPSLLTDEQQEQVNEALKQWTADGGFRQHNLTLAIVAREMHVPVRHLQLWLSHSEYKKLATLMNHLRIEEAKRVMKNNPDWSAESVADYCGFSSRQYFHQLFVQYTGITPAKFQKTT